ncbi:MAG: dNTP triphosphohydrolase [Ichthyobacteriaceae bacterium]|nr:dNTP triphosphohydrolase [Ichthyobacteriaceae bacterium]
MNWVDLLSLKRFGDNKTRLRKDEDETRLGFEVDYDRIIFSTPFRNLQDKTQVIPLSKGGFAHTRLTHSLEVSSVGRSLGRNIGKVIIEKYPILKEKGYKANDFGAIVAAAGLAHDIGNPPFGHSGEGAIGQYFKTGNGSKFKDQLTDGELADLTRFEGNANGFRLITESNQGVNGGLRLSYATLGAFTKYPKESIPKYDVVKSVVEKKYGFFQTGISEFEDIANELKLKKFRNNEFKNWVRHPLAFLVEAADDICYSIIDFEDGLNLGLIDQDKALDMIMPIVKDRIILKKYESINLNTDRNSYLRALAIGVLVGDVTQIFIDNETDILNGTFTKSLLDISNYNQSVENIKKLTMQKVYKNRKVVEIEAAGFVVLGGLMDIFIDTVNNLHNNELTSYDIHILDLLPTQYIGVNKIPEASIYKRILNICAYLSSMTDTYAISLYKKLKGIELPT